MDNFFFEGGGDILDDGGLFGGDDLFGLFDGPFGDPNNLDPIGLLPGELGQGEMPTIGFEPVLPELDGGGGGEEGFLVTPPEPVDSMDLEISTPESPPPPPPREERQTTVPLVFHDEADAARRAVLRHQYAAPPPKKKPKKKLPPPPPPPPQRPTWLSLLTPQTADPMAWLLQQSHGLWDEIQHAMVDADRVLPDARVMAKLAQKDPEIFHALDRYGVFWKVLLNLDVLGVANYTGVNDGSIATFIDAERLMLNIVRFCVPFYGAVYVKKSRLDLAEVDGALKLYQWRVWKLLLEMRRRVRANWSRARLLFPLPPSEQDEKVESLRPYSRTGVGIIPQDPLRQRIFHHEALCFITRDEFPWPVMVASDKIGFAMTATSGVYHRLEYPVYGLRHRSANMALVLLDKTVLFVAICDVNGQPGLVAQTFHAWGLVAFGIKHYVSLLGQESRTQATFLEFVPPKEGAPIATGTAPVVLLHDLRLDSWPVELVGAQRAVPQGLPVLPVSIMVTSTALALAYTDGLLHVRCSLSAEGGGALDLASARFVPWLAFVPALGLNAAKVVMRPLPGDVPLASPPRPTTMEHLPDDAFYSPLRPGAAEAAWVDLPMISAVPGEALSRNTALLTLWRQTEDARGLPLALVRPPEQLTWDNLQMEGVITGLLVRFYEPWEAGNPDDLRDITPEVRAKVIAFARGHRLANPDTPLMQANVAGVAIVDASSLEGGARTIVTLLPWPSIRDGTLANYTRVVGADTVDAFGRQNQEVRTITRLRADLLVYPERRLPRTRAAWFFESDAITIVHCVPDQNMLMNEEDEAVRDWVQYTVCLRTVLIGEYAKGKAVTDGEHSRILHKNIKFRDYKRNAAGIAFALAYCKGSLVLLSRAETAPRPWNGYLYLSVLEGPPYRVHKAEKAADSSSSSSSSSSGEPPLKKRKKKKKLDESTPFMLTSGHV